MSEFERFALALAKTESDDQELAFGDAAAPSATSMVHTLAGSFAVHGGQFLAIGRWQIHPVWYAEWADPAIQVGWSWDTAFRAALRRFWDEYERQGVANIDRAMIFHLGASAFARGDRDDAYAVRFVKCWSAHNSENKV